MKAKLKCKTPAKAQTNFRKAQRTQMNQAARRESRQTNCNERRLS
jgi:hypothetical protein